MGQAVQRNEQLQVNYRYYLLSNYYVADFSKYGIVVVFIFIIIKSHFLLLAENTYIFLFNSLFSARNKTYPLVKK